MSDKELFEADAAPFIELLFEPPRSTNWKTVESSRFGQTKTPFIKLGWIEESDFLSEVMRIRAFEVAVDMEKTNSSFDLT